MYKRASSSAFQRAETVAGSERGHMGDFRRVDAFMELKASLRRGSIGEADYEVMKAELFNGGDGEHKICQATRAKE